MVDTIQNLPKDSNDKPLETVRIVDSKAQQVQPFSTALQGVPISSSSQQFGGNPQASFAPESDFPLEERQYNDQSQSFFGRENPAFDPMPESNYQEEAGQFSQMNFGTEGDSTPESFDGMRGAPYQNENDRSANSFEGNMIPTDNSVF